MIVEILIAGFLLYLIGLSIALVYVAVKRRGKSAKKICTCCSCENHRATQTAAVSAFVLWELFK